MDRVALRDLIALDGSRGLQRARHDREQRVDRPAERVQDGDRDDAGDGAEKAVFDGAGLSGIYRDTFDFHGPYSHFYGLTSSYPKQYNNRKIHIVK